MSEANSINASTTGIVGNTGTGFTGTAVTQYDVIVGGATSSTLTSVSPSTAGFVLTSNGVSADPSFQAIPFSSGFQPNTVVQVYDDFFGPDVYVDNGSASTIMTTANSSWLTVNASSGIWAVGPSNTTNPGTIGSVGATGSIGIGSTQSISQSGRGGSSYSSFVLGAGALSCNWVVNLGSLSSAAPRFLISLGMNINGVTAVGSDYILFQYTDNVNSGNWTINTSKASSVTQTNTSVAATTSGFHNFGFVVNADASLVSFTIDGASVGTINTNIPVVSITPWASLRYGSSVTVLANTLNLDLFYLQQTLTTPR